MHRLTITALYSLLCIDCFSSYCPARVFSLQTHTSWRRPHAQHWFGSREVTLKWPSDYFPLSFCNDVGYRRWNTTNVFDYQEPASIAVQVFCVSCSHQEFLSPTSVFRWVKIRRATFQWVFVSSFYDNLLQSFRLYSSLEFNVVLVLHFLLLFYFPTLGYECSKLASWKPKNLPQAWSRSS